MRFQPGRIPDVTALRSWSANAEVYQQWKRDRIVKTGWQTKATEDLLRLLIDTVDLTACMLSYLLKYISVNVVAAHMAPNANWWKQAAEHIMNVLERRPRRRDDSVVVTIELSTPESDHQTPGASKYSDQKKRHTCPTPGEVPSSAFAETVHNIIVSTEACWQQLQASKPFQATKLQTQAFHDVACFTACMLDLVLHFRGCNVIEKCLDANSKWWKQVATAVQGSTARPQPPRKPGLHILVRLSAPHPHKQVATEAGKSAETSSPTQSVSSTADVTAFSEEPPSECYTATTLQTRSEEEEKMADMSELRRQLVGIIRSMVAEKVLGLCEAWLQTLVHKPAALAEWPALIDALVMRDAAQALREVIAHPQAPHLLVPLASSVRDTQPSILQRTIGSSWSCLTVVLESLMRNNELPDDCLSYTQRNKPGAITLATFLLAEISAVDIHQVPKLCRTVAQFLAFAVRAIPPTMVDVAFFSSAKERLSEKQLVELCAVLYTEPPRRPVYVYASDEEDCDG